MNLSVGIVGLPNVGKSTLFNALLKKQAAFVANYPFATIEPNIGVVPVPDERLQKLAEITKEEEKMDGLPPIKPATVEFVDIAGLVKGAAEGEGLGNKFLSHIREASVIAHVVRDFDPSTGSGQGTIIKVGTNPAEDYQTIQTELILSDLQSVNSSKFKVKSSRLPKPGTGGQAKLQSKVQSEILDKSYNALNKGVPVRDIAFSKEEKEIVDQLFLLSAKPEIIVLNVSEEDYSEEKIPGIIKRYKEILNPVIASEAKQSHDSGQARMTREIASPAFGVARNDDADNMVVISAKIEAELSELTEEEQKEYLKNLGLEKSGLERLIQKAYETLGLISFLTAGEKEVRAWTIEQGTNAQNSAGTIHTDFIKNFIKAEVVSYQGFVENNGWKGSREAGKAKMEGKDYIMKDGDVVEFKIGK